MKAERRLLAVSVGLAGPLRRLQGATQGLGDKQLSLTWAAASAAPPTRTPSLHLPPEHVVLPHTDSIRREIHRTCLSVPCSLCFQEGGCARVAGGTIGERVQVDLPHKIVASRTAKLAL